MANILHRHMTCLGDTITFDIKASIVERIIGGMFFREDDVLSGSGSDRDDDGAKDSVARKAERKACQKRGSLRLFVKDDADLEWYHVSINNATRFELATDMVAIGMSFRHTAGAIQLARERTKQAILSGMSDQLVSQYTRVLVGACLQDI